MDREDIRLGIRNIKNLPTLPIIVSRVLEVADDSGASANELAEIVARDMSVSAKVLNLANSAFYGFSRRITTIPQAVVVLGFETVRSLALSVSVFESLNSSQDAASFDREAFWVHSIGCGTVSRITAKTPWVARYGDPVCRRPAARPGKGDPGYLLQRSLPGGGGGDG